MMAYCKVCRCSHAAWARYNDGAICGRCGTRLRNHQIVPLNASLHPDEAYRRTPYTVVRRIS